MREAVKSRGKVEPASSLGKASRRSQGLFWDHHSPIRASLAQLTLGHRPPDQYMSLLWARTSKGMAGNDCDP